MRDIEPPFEIEYRDNLAIVTETALKSRRVFHVKFSGANPALTITVGIGSRDEKFWTSIPEGRQEEAEEIGRLIASYIRNKNK